MVILMNRIMKRDVFNAFSILIPICTCSILMLPITVSQLSLDLQTWIDRENLDKIVRVKSVLEGLNFGVPPIFVFYGVDVNLMSYYSNIVGMQIGQHHVYYGKVQFLVQGMITPSVFIPDEFHERKLSLLLFETLEKKGVLDEIDVYPIILIVPEFYNRDVDSLIDMQEFKDQNGIFVIPPRNERMKMNLISSVVVCYTDFLNSSGNEYPMTYPWAKALYVLEHYSEGMNIPSYFVEFPIITFENYSCQIEVRIFDAANNWSPIEFYIDDSHILTYNYSGKMGPTNVTLEVAQKLDGLHRLAVVIEGNRQILRLDIIRVIFYHEMS